MFWLDSTILAVLGLGALLGALSGLLWQVARLAGLVAAVYAAVVLNEPASALVHEGFLQGADPRAARLAAYGGVFLAVYLVFYFLTYLLYQGLEAARLEPLDRLLGAALGLAKAGLILAGLCWGLASYPHPKTQELLGKSLLAPILAEGLDSLLRTLPPEFTIDSWEELRPFWDRERGKKKV